MNETEMKQLGKKLEQTLNTLKAKRKKIGRVLVGITLVAFVVLVVITIQRAGDATKIKEENEELQVSLSDTENELANTKNKLENTQNELTTTQEQLTYAESQVNLLEESTSALVEQVGEMEKKITELEELLNVKDTPPVITRNQLEQQLSALSELVTAKYFYRNATRKEASKTWLWGWTLPFSDTSLLAAYDGTIKAGIDFKAIDVNVNERQHIITVTLPASKITDNNIPQETINVLEVKNNLFNEVTFNDYNQFISEEKKVMEEMAIAQGLLQEANEEAKTIITAFLSQIPGMDTYKLIVQ